MKLVVTMEKILFLFGVLYVGVAFYIAEWFVIASYFTFLLLLFLTIKVLKIKGYSDLKTEISRYWGEAITATVGAAILPYLVCIKSNTDIELALIFSFMVVPNAFLIGYLWLRGLNKLFSLIKLAISPKKCSGTVNLVT